MSFAGRFFIMQSRPDPSSSDPVCPLPFMATAAFGGIQLIELPDVGLIVCDRSNLGWFPELAVLVNDQDMAVLALGMVHALLALTGHFEVSSWECGTVVANR